MSRPAIAGAAASLVIAGCTPAISSSDAGEPPFAECKADSYAFIGRTTLAALGLREMWPEEAGRPGEIWITAGPVSIPAPPGQPAQPAAQMICLEFEDGSGMSGPIDGGWRAPTGVDLDAGRGVRDALPIVVALAGIAVIAAASAYAFRRTAGPGPDG